MQKLAKDYIAKLKWVTLKEVKTFHKETGLQYGKIFSVVYTIEGARNTSPKRKKQIYKDFLEELKEDKTQMYPYCMSKLRRLILNTNGKSWMEEMVGC